MKPYCKALLYVALAALIPLGELAAVTAKNSAWPTRFESVAVAIQAITQALLALKMYYSDPNPPPLPPPPLPPV